MLNVSDICRSVEFEPKDAGNENGKLEKLSKFVEEYNKNGERMAGAVP